MPAKATDDAAGNAAAEPNISEPTGDAGDALKYASLVSLLPTLLPIAMRALRRYPVPAALIGVSVLLLAAADRRRRRFRYSPYID